MDKPTLAILLHKPDLRLAGGYEVVDVNELCLSNPSSFQALPLICPTCYGPVAPSKRNSRSPENSAFILHHLADDFGCVPEATSAWITPLAKIPNAFSDAIQASHFEYDLDDARVSAFRNRLVRSETRQLRPASSVTELVHCFRHYGPSLSSRPFHLLGSSAACWGELFVNKPSSTKNSSFSESERRVFCGKFDGEHLAEDGNILYLRERNGRMRIECKIPYQRDSRRFKSLLPKDFEYDQKSDFDIYVLGSPQFESEFTASVSVSSSRYVCMTPRIVD